MDLTSTENLDPSVIPGPSIDAPLSSNSLASTSSTAGPPVPSPLPTSVEDLMMDEHEFYDGFEAELVDGEEDDLSLPPSTSASGGQPQSPGSSSTNHKKRRKIPTRPWTEAENEKLLEIVTTHNEKNWKKIAEHFPTRTHLQCVQQWKHVVNPRIGRGSWTAKEDTKLLQLVTKYGKKWSLIAEYLPRREGKRCRERYMNHLNPDVMMAGTTSIPWSLEEEKVLTMAYNALGNHWAEIQKRLPRRSIADVQNHHLILVRRQMAIQLGKTEDLAKHSSKGTINRWTEGEQALLRTLVEEYGPKKWLFIASHIVGKSDLQCMQHWRNVINPKVVKGKGSWTEYEDRMLLDRVEVLGKKWSKIAEFMPGRISKQCRERYINHLDPDLNKGAWTEEEDKILLELQPTNWNKWALIARSLPGRSANAVKNRWYSAGQKKINGGTVPSISQKSFTSLAPDLLVSENHLEPTKTTTDASSVLDNLTSNLNSSTGTIVTAVI